MRSVTRARLRTKTGCLTCRRRRKKCDEDFPVCGECRNTTRDCQWPASADLLDRRFASHDESRHRAAAGPKDGGSHGQPHGQSSGPPGIGIASHLRAESGIAHIAVSRDMPVVLSRHFADRYFNLILLPTCHPAFHNDWLARIQHLMNSQKSLFYSVLACSASHIHLLDTSTSAQSFALTYYTNSTRALSTHLNDTPHPENDNGLLTSIILLYLHGCMGLGTYSDIPIHVDAAVRIITSRLFDRNGPIRFLFDRIAIESVLYQIFLVSTGLWTKPPETDYAFDAPFWRRAENLMERSALFSGGQAEALNSPVLGVPASLFRLCAILRQQFRSGTAVDPSVINSVSAEVEAWELALLSTNEWSSCSIEPEVGEQQLYRDAKSLYVIIISLLLGQLARTKAIGDGTPLSEPRESWQVSKAIRILKRHEHATAWSRCYIGNWPVYTVGLFMSAAEDQEVVRDDLKRRWNAMGFAQVLRFRQDLEMAWSRR